MDKLDKCYYWHIITLAKMKNELKEIRKKELIQNTAKVLKLNSFLKNIYKNTFFIYFNTES